MTANNPSVEQRASSAVNALARIEHWLDRFEAGTIDPEGALDEIREETDYFRAALAAMKGDKL